MIPKTDALVISLRVLRDETVEPGNVEVRGGLIRLRFMLPGEAGLDGCFSEEACAMTQAILERLRGVLGVFVMSDFEARLSRVALRECRATVGHNAQGERLVALRFRHCQGNALTLFAADKLPTEALSTSHSRPGADVLEKLLMPLLNLRQYLTDFPVEAVAADLRRLDSVISGITQQISAIEEEYRGGDDAALARPPMPSGIESAVSSLTRELFLAKCPSRAGQHRPVPITYFDDSNS
jgi:hypothetical protein